MVSIDGAVFERSGTMSGGGGKPRGGRMGTSIKDSSVSRESIATAEKELESVRSELAAARQRVSVAAQEYQTSLKAVSQLQLDIAKTKMEVTLSTILTSSIFQPDAFWRSENPNAALSL